MPAVFYGIAHIRTWRIWFTATKQMAAFTLRRIWSSFRWILGHGFLCQVNFIWSSFRWILGHGFLCQVNFFSFFLSFFLRKVYFTLFGEKANVDLPLDTRFSVTDVFNSLFFPRTVYFILFGRADWMVEKKCNRLRFQVKKKASKF